MDVLICILLNFPKGATLASSDSSSAPSIDIRTAKKTVCGLQNHVHLKKTAFHDWTMSISDTVDFHDTNKMTNAIQ